MKTISKIIFLSLGVIFLTGCQQQNKTQPTTQNEINKTTQDNKKFTDKWLSFKSDQFKLEFDYPKNWKIDETNFGMLSIIPPGGIINEDDIFDMGMFIDENIDNKKLNFDDVIKFTKDYYNDSSYFDVISEKEITIQNTKAYSAVYMKKGGELQKSQISFLHRNQIYGLRFYAPKNIHNEYINTFEEIINSIKFME